METKNNLIKKIMILTAVCTAFFCGCTFLGGNNTIESPSSEDVYLDEKEKESTEEKNENEPNNSDTSVPGEGDVSGEGENPEGTDENKDNTDNDTKPSLNNPTSDNENAGNGNSIHNEYSVLRDTSLSSQWDIIDTVCEAAQDFYTENFNKTRILSYNGYLYNYAAKSRIDVSYLVNEGMLNSTYISSGAEILLLDADSMKNYETVNVKQTEKGLTVFVAVKNPKDNTYLIASGRSPGGYLSASQYAALLNSYYQNHGSVGQLFSGNDEYNRIVNFISMYESRYDKYFVRSIIKDNKYAVVVLSSQSNTAEVKEYILKRSSSIWEVVMEGLETEPRVPIAVNKKLPDFNLSMLPEYTINDYIMNINSSNNDIIRLMLVGGQIESPDDVEFISSSRNFCYVALNNAVKYLCIKDGENWDINQVSSSGEAVKKIKSYGKDTPTFIVYDN